MLRAKKRIVHKQIGKPWQTMANPTWFHHVPSINTQKCYGNTCTHILNHPEQFVSAHHITSKKTIQWT